MLPFIVRLRFICFPNIITLDFRLFTVFFSAEKHQSIQLLLGPAKHSGDLNEVISPQQIKQYRVWDGDVGQKGTCIFI